jgi:ABC-type transport system involved in cytochrome c biogenesis permease subunit
MDESLLLRAALGAYALAAAAPWVLARWERVVRLALAAALGLHTLALALRWQAHGQGPFTTLHEILSSNLWSLALVFALAALGWREVRRAWIVAAPVIVLLGLWLLQADGARGHLPATYATSLLYWHALAGKLFLGLLLVATALGLLPLLARVDFVARRLGGAASAGDGDTARAAACAPRAERIDALAYAFAAFAFVADGLMLVIGAVWAQDAWGRYWAWDPLETWAFATWLALAAALHARATLRPTPQRFGLWLAGVFVLAFLTFFGVPFVSTSPHKGAI